MYMPWVMNLTNQVSGHPLLVLVAQYTSIYELDNQSIYTNIWTRQPTETYCTAQETILNIL